MVKNVRQFVRGQHETQSPRRELDPRPTHYECVALPLSYPGATLYSNDFLNVIHVGQSQFIRIWELFENISADHLGLDSR